MKTRIEEEENNEQKIACNAYSGRWEQKKKALVTCTYGCAWKSRQQQNIKWE